MAVSIDAGNAQFLGGTAATMLFKRVPDKLFGPLASPNRNFYWLLLCLLHRRRFGPDAPLPSVEGFLAREITRDIEEALNDADDWEDDSGGADATPVNIRANGILQTLLDAGWLKLERSGFERRISMSPVVAQFLSRLVAFAETGPVFVAGKIRSVEANLKIALDSGEGSSLIEAAETARNLLEHIRNTGTNVRDLMEELGAEAQAREYIRLFFSRYIESVFIGDYRQLRTKNHPLANRTQILEMVEHLYSDDGHRTRLINWYESNQTLSDRHRATRLFERDIGRLQELSLIDDYLDRLDDEIRRANKRALIYLDYRLRSSRPLDDVIKIAVARLIGQGDATYDTAFSPGRMLEPSMLAEPRKQTVRPAPDAIRQRAPSIREKARSRLLARNRNTRSMSAPELASFVARALGDGESVEKRSLKIDTIKDLRSLQTLHTLALHMGTRSRSVQATARSMTRGFRLESSSDDEVTDEYISGRPFVITLAKGKR